MLGGGWPRTGWLLLALPSLLLGCGARAMAGTAGDEPAEGGQGGGAGLTGAPGSGQGATPSEVDVTVDAPDAVVVPDECDAFRRADERSRACPYIYRGVCYDSVDCACSRACSIGAQCVVEGFLQPEATQRVRCISP